jgi:hypothetical protein
MIAENLRDVKPRDGRFKTLRRAPPGASPGTGRVSRQAAAIRGFGAREPGACSPASCDFLMHTSGCTSIPCSNASESADF